MPTQHTPLLALPYPESGADLVAEGDDILRELATRLEVVVGPPSGSAGGDLGGSYPNPQVVLINGRAVSAVVFTDDTRLSNSRPPTGVAGGDLAGSTYPNPVVATINGRAKTAVVFTDDARLADTRTPVAHAASHRAGGTDALAATAAAAVQVRDVGEAGQIRAGRVLTPADFTAMGLAGLRGLWNLANVNDASAGARNLTNKNAVPFGPGIMGAASEAAVFAGSLTQALYIADTGDADTLRILTGSLGCWFRTAKRGTTQFMISKASNTAAGSSYRLYVDAATNAIAATGWLAGGLTPTTVAGVTDVADDRWHFAVVTHDGSKLRVYVDGALEGSGALNGPLNQFSDPFNISGYGADAATNVLNYPFYGRVDEAFITSDVLSDDQVRNLYCARIPHALALAPTTALLAVRRRRRGGPLAFANFQTAVNVTHIYNFIAGAITDSGAFPLALTPNPGTGVINDVAAADGAAANAKSLSGAHNGLSASDAGLPSGLAPRSYGAWFKTSSVTGRIVSWGTPSTGATQIGVNPGGQLATWNGTTELYAAGPPQSVADGLWHHGVVVEDDAAADGLKRKLYLDGRLHAAYTVLTALTLAGANRFRVGAAPDGTVPFTGTISRVFAYAGALTPEQIRAVYNVGSQALAPSPTDAGAHVEAMDATALLAVFDTLEGCDQIDLGVAV